jgi:hypothetical protein
MKKLIAGLFALVALCGLAATAFAAGNGNTVWLCNGQFLVLERCLVDSENLEVQKLYDLVAMSGVECTAEAVQDEGWVGPGSEDEVTTVIFLEATTLCKPTAKGLNTKEEEVTNACKKVEAVLALNTPWATLVYLEGTAVWDLLSAIGSKQPGYLIKCEIAGGTKQNDECLINASHTPLVEVLSLEGNATELPLVSALFPAVPLENAELATCSVGGAESGLVLGEDLQEGLIGGTQVSLELSEE